MTTSDRQPVLLPPVRVFQQFCAHEDGWTDHYGALHVAAQYAGLTMPARYRVRGIWMHGAGGPWEHAIPGIYYLNSPMAMRWPVFLARDDEVECLRAHGCPQVRAMGLPIVYTTGQAGARIPGSLLVMPTHTLIGDTYPDRTEFERYAAEIVQIAPHFSRVVICIHPNCRKNGLWIREFSRCGFEIVYGAQTNDLNALARMRGLFEQFESVTTNGWGSHVAYALAFGARASIHGTKPEVREENMLRDTAWAVDKQALATALSSKMDDERRAFLKSFHVPPTKGVGDVPLGRWFIGEQHKLSPEEMGVVLSAIVDPAPKALASRVVAPGFEGTKPSGSLRRGILFVVQEASRTGAPMFLLHFLRWLRRTTDTQFEVLCVKGGALLAEFAKVAPVHQPGGSSLVPGAVAGFDLIYANGIGNGEQIDALRVGDVPILTHVHDLDCGYEWTGALKMALCLRQTAHFVVCSRAVGQRFQARFGVPEARCTLHYEMVDESQVLASDVAGGQAELRARYDLPEEAFVVAGCGTFDLRKGVDLFVQAARQLKQLVGHLRPLRFVWVGAFTARDLRIALEEDLRKLDLVNEVRFVGELAEPHALLALSDVFWMTSREDPFPLAMLEAAALGKPVICFEGAGGTPEFCGAGGGLTVPYLDSASLAATTYALLVDADRRAAIGGRAAELVRERFTVAAVSPALWQTIQEVVSRSVDVARVDERQRTMTQIFAQWRPEHAPQRAFVAAHLHRQEVRARARMLAQKGRHRDAVQLLVKAVSEDLASKDPWIMCEGLLQIGEDLSVFDAKQAGLLLDRAAGIAKSAQLNLDSFRTKPLVARGP